MAIRVKATQMGYYDNGLKREGVEFVIRSPREFSERWMENLGEESEDEAPQAPLRSKPGPKPKAKTQSTDSVI